MLLEEVERRLDRVRLHRSWDRAGAALREFWSLVLPTECVVCTRHDSSLCSDCAAELRRATVRPFRAESGAEGLPEAENTSDLSTGMVEDDASEPLPVIAAGEYAKALSAAVLGFKNHGHTDIARWLQAALAGALHQARWTLCREPASVILIPVPPRGASIRRRGYDPLSLLLGGLGRRHELPAGCRVVPAIRYRHLPVTLRRLVPGGLSQKDLGRRGRRSNLVGSMETTPASREVLLNRQCIIVDDVLTTGATISEVARVLRGAGAIVVGAVVLAATPPPRGERPQNA